MFSKPSFPPLSKNFVCAISLTLSALFLSSCATSPGTFSKRKGDEIIVAGQLVHTGTRVVTWLDAGGYDAYRTEKKFPSPKDNERNISRLGFGFREHNLTDAEIERVRTKGWDLPTLQKVVDQFVIHFDVAGASKSCFRVLHDVRGLAVQFMLDLDGTIYQTLDLKEAAWHATSSNDRSVGIEIANMGAYSEKQRGEMEKWYRHEADGKTVCFVPSWIGTNAQYTPNFVGAPARRQPVEGEVQGKDLFQYDFTPQQYAALVKLTATLCQVFPKINCDYPRDASGKVVSHKLPKEDLQKYTGVLGHFHVQTDKTDPGPAFQWDYVIENARREMHSGTEHAAEHKPVKLSHDN